jgi:hypothetical protein
MSDMAQFVSRLNLSRFVARLRVERDLTTRSLLHQLLIEEASNLAFNLGQLSSLQREVIAGRARIAIQIAVVETLAANGQDARLAESILCDLIEVQKTIERYRQIIVEAMDRNHDTQNAAKIAVAWREERTIRLIAVAGFVLVVATSAQAMTPAPIHQPDGESKVEAELI